MAVWDLIAVLCPFGPLRVLIELTEEKGIKVPDALIYSTSLEETGGGGGAGRSPVAHLPGLGLTANGGGDGDSARSAEEGSGGGNNRTTQPPATSIPGLGIGNGSSAPRTAGSPASGGHDGSAAASAQRRRQSQTVAQHQASIDAERRAEAEEEAAEHSGPKLGLGDFIFYSVLMVREMTIRIFASLCFYKAQHSTRDKTRQDWTRRDVSIFTVLVLGVVVLFSLPSFSFLFSQDHHRVSIHVLTCLSGVYMPVCGACGALRLPCGAASFLSGFKGVDSAERRLGGRACMLPFHHPRADGDVVDLDLARESVASPSDPVVYCNGYVLLRRPFG